MIKEIHYAGYSTEPSDYECADGQLATSLNLINEDSQLKPLFQPHKLLQLDNGCEVVYVHKTINYEHYIIQNTTTNDLYWFDSDVSSVSLSSTNKIGNYYGISHINSVGNTLMVFTKSAINYILWKTDNYKVLGNKLPEIAISFGLVGHPRLYSLVTEDGSSSKRGTFSISFNSIGKGDIFNTFTDENKTKITSQVMAKVNKFVAEQTTNKGRFCFPFFVRWAYRLFDGSHVMHSAPILMTPSTTPAPIVFWKRVSGKNSYTDAECDIMMVAADLDYCLARYADYFYLTDWQDIISGIDIFISKPIYTYDQSGEFSSFNDEDNMESVFIGKLYNGEKDKGTSDTKLASDITEDRMLSPLSSTDFMSKYMEWTYAHIYALYFAKDRKVPNTTLHMPEFSDDKRDESIEANANFYKLTSIDITELEAGKRKTIAIKEDYLQSLTNREVMKDDYLTHDRLIASSSYGFNSRLNLSGVKRVLFKGFISNGMFAYCENEYSFNANDATNSVTIKTGTFDSGQVTIRVYIRENGKVYYVESEPGLYVSYLRNFVSTSNWSLTTTVSDGSKTVTTYDFTAGTKTVKNYDSSGNVISTENFTNRYKPTAWGSWLFYPNNNAFKIAIFQYSQLAFVCDLKSHDFLNGAYAFLGFKSERGNSSTIGSLPNVTQSYSTADGFDGPVVDVPNKIYTSEVNNPFYFPLLGINTVGTGTILGISSAVKALSQGQFGQFPLYAFTTEGVWALEVSSTGSYTARQPVTRDVCINANSITQIDDAVLFATDRGIMLIQGSQTQCITDTIFSEAPFNVLDLPAIDQLHAKLGHTADTCLPVKPFLGFLAGCRMIYDYVHQHIIVYNPTTLSDGKPQYTYAYVFSLKSKMWGMMYSNIQSGINAYPDALAMTNDNTLVSFSTTDETVCKGLFITRPLKLETADVHKTISALIQRGHFQRGDVGTVLYGSRDLFNWRLIWSSKDHYLRGFRGTPYKYFRIAGMATLTDGKSIFGASVQFDTRHTNNLR